MTIFGPDLSHYQAGIDLARVATEGCDFVIGKISQGSSFRDSQWPHTRDEGPAAGLIVAGYHYVDGSAPDQQAACCASWIGDKSLPVALDWEKDGGNWAHLMRVLDEFRRAGMNVRLLYTGGWYHQQVGSPDMTGCGLALWKSRYPTSNGGSPTGLYARVPSSYWAGLGGLDTRLLQFTDHASIAGRSVDCSAFPGTRDELAALLGGSAPTQGDDMASVPQSQWDEVYHALTDLLHPWLGGVSNVEPTEADGSDAEGYRLAQYLLRNNVEVHQALRAVQRLDAKVDALAGITPGPAGASSLSDADVGRIAAAVAANLAQRMES